jgi:hypothetical protein
MTASAVLNHRSSLTRILHRLDSGR